MLNLAKRIARRVLGEASIYRVKHLLGIVPEAYHNDQVALALVDRLVRTFEPSSFVETGTFQGGTTRYMAVTYPELPIHSIEINATFHENCRKKLQPYRNVRLYHGSSEKIIAEGLDARWFGPRPFFYLDAHWYDYWPLCDEVRLIGRHLDEAVMVIDDFEVPGRPDFTFDEGGGQPREKGQGKCNLALIQDCFSRDRPYRIVFPNYQLADCGAGSLIGSVIILQGLGPQAVETFQRTGLVRQYFKEHPLKA